MPTSPIVQVLLVLVVAGCAFGLWKGDRPERIGALVILLNSGLTVAGGEVLSDEYGYLMGLALDGLTALGLLVMTMFYGRVWLGLAMLVYAGQFGLRSYYLVTQRDHDYFHAVVNNMNFMALILLIVAGTTMAWRRRTAGRN